MRAVCVLRVFSLNSKTNREIKVAALQMNRQREKNENIKHLMESSHRHHMHTRHSHIQSICPIHTSYLSYTTQKQLSLRNLQDLFTISEAHTHTSSRAAADVVGVFVLHPSCAVRCYYSMLQCSGSKDACFVSLA